MIFGLIGTIIRILVLPPPFILTLSSRLCSDKFQKFLLRWLVRFSSCIFFQQIVPLNHDLSYRLIVLLDYSLLQSCIWLNLNVFIRKSVQQVVWAIIWSSNFFFKHDTQNRGCILIPLGIFSLYVTGPMRSPYTTCQSKETILLKHEHWLMLVHRDVGIIIPNIQLRTLVRVDAYLLVASF